MKYRFKPVVASFPSADPPAAPPGVNVACMTGPGSPALSPNCPVVAWNEYVYWAFSYDDNREGMCIVAYEEDGTMVKRWDKAGARYVYRITIEEEAETITFWGQSDNRIVMNWSELYLMTPPTEGKVPADVHPPIPAGLDAICLQDPNKGDLSPTYPVIEWNGYTYWAYSYLDNRVAMNIVAYDMEGNIVRQWDKSGARYVYKITVDASAQTITFRGQSDAAIVMNWADLAL